eukprot:SAG11_NODE_14990_length_592_cov_0.835700_1_plen_32_part_01
MRAERSARAAGAVELLVQALVRAQSNGKLVLE